MPGFFEAMAQLPERNKKHYVKIQGKEIEVSLEKKLQVQRAGEEMFILKGNEIIEKPKTTTARQFPTLSPSDNGLVFHAGDPYWVEVIQEKGFAWQIESE